MTQCMHNLRLNTNRLVLSSHLMLIVSLHLHQNNFVQERLRYAVHVNVEELCYSALQVQKYRCYAVRVNIDKLHYSGQACL